MKTIFVVLALMVAAVSAHCPNGCSGHGTCGASDVCSCYQNWQGGDCSLRTCSYELAWVDTPTADDTAHYYAECANKGVCDRESGQCTCFEGYEGKACKRASCSNDCSGHGTCEFIEQLGADTHMMRVVDPVTRAGASDPTYTLWDENMVQGCACDPGFEGADCSLRTCPFGDDPLTMTNTDTMVQLVHIASFTVSTQHFALEYHDPYGATWRTTKISGSTEANVATSAQAALRALPNRALDTVTVAANSGAANKVLNAGRTAAGTDVDCSSDWCLSVTFPNTPGTTGLQYLMTCITGAMGAGYYPISDGSGVGTCVVYENAVFASLSYGENAACANRGLCDESTGSCECFTGFRGLACENQEALA